MKITYNKNPFHTAVELNEHEKKELWYKIKVEELEELLFRAHFHLQEKKYFDLDKAKKILEPDYYCSDDEKSPIDKRCDDMLGYYLDDLQFSHFGDCICVACSCSKCHAESLLGIDTLAGLGKHMAHKINGAFGKNNENSIEEAIEILANYDPTPPPGNEEHWEKKGGYEQYFPQWKAEAKVAHDWLVNYKNKFLS